jgi:hypothetical protein
MKDLNIYLEGLLNKSDKKSTDSGRLVAIGEYIETYIKQWSVNTHITYSVSDKTISLECHRDAPIVIRSEYLKELITDYGIKKLIVKGDVVINLSDNFYQSITIECNQKVTIKTNFLTDGTKEIENINIKSNKIDISEYIEFKRSNIQTHTLILHDILYSKGCNIYVDDVIFSFTSNHELNNLINRTGISHIEDSKNVNHDEIEKIKSIDPEKIFKLKKYNMRNIVLNNMELYEDGHMLVFTKNPGSIKLKCSNIYELVNKWYAVWVKNIKQFEL